MAKEKESSEGEAVEQPSAGAEGQGGAEISKDARMWAMFCHLMGLAGFVIPVVGNIVGPLIFWQLKKDEYTFV